ncbi:MAG TPA: hypothetical protein DIC34_11705 [Treponema sp.]|nr:MAG: hypothetical protein A2001_10930 [Treponema sp. GWC1_61_84]OHE73507.1 MAG: hypothetical protein A2413_16620 [Treponema sp. RIFOXYC1_FULL_61_9]HCM27190.1 hypothetical protein [Treponema sp.]
MRRPRSVERKSQSEMATSQTPLAVSADDDAAVNGVHKAAADGDRFGGAADADTVFAGPNLVLRTIRE